MPYIYDYPRPCVSCDTVVFDLSQDTGPEVLLVKRRNEPFKDMWAIPGGFLDIEEELEDSAVRELYEETGVNLYPQDLHQCLAVGRAMRDPRARIISVVYTAAINRTEHPICAGDDAKEVAWFNMGELPTLAADHLSIIRHILGEVYHDRS